MPRIYATPEDLTDWTGKPAPANATSLLRSASVLVEDATLTAIYAVDRDGIPTLPKVLKAFKDATCEQTDFWARNSIDPDKDTLEMQTKLSPASKAISGANIAYFATDIQGAKQAKLDAVNKLCAQSLRILRNAQLITTAVQS